MQLSGTHPRNLTAPISRIQCARGSASSAISELSNLLYIPLPTEPRQTSFTSEQLMHGRLLQVALLGDHLIQASEQRIDIAQRRRNRSLFGEGRNE